MKLTVKIISVKKFCTEVWALLKNGVQLFFPHVITLCSWNYTANTVFSSTFQIKKKRSNFYSIVSRVGRNYYGNIPLLLVVQKITTVGEKSRTKMANISEIYIFARVGIFQ